MKKLLFTLFVSVLSLAASNAQSVFHVTPNPSDTVGTGSDLPAHGHITNLTNNTIHLRWERTVIMNSGCQTAVCDPVTCYSRTVSARNLNMDPNQSGELTVHFYPDDMNYCEGIVHLKIKNLDNPSDSLIAIYTMNLASDVKDLPAANVQVFPNPTVDYFSLKNDAEVGVLELFSLEGRLIATMNVDPSNQYSLAQQPAGNYILALRDKKGNLFQALEINKK